MRPSLMKSTAVTELVSVKVGAGGGAERENNFKHSLCLFLFLYGISGSFLRVSGGFKRILNLFAFDVLVKKMKQQL